MKRNDFEIVKSLVTPQEVAQRYVMPVDRVGFISCPFHMDKHASMRVGGRNRQDKFTCMGECKWDGDIFDFVGQLFNISQLEALKKINEDFGLHLEVGKPSKELYKQIEQKQAQKKREQVKQQWFDKQYIKYLSSLTEQIRAFESIYYASKPNNKNNLSKYRDTELPDICIKAIKNINNLTKKYDDFLKMPEEQKRNLINLIAF